MLNGILLAILVIVPVAISSAMIVALRIENVADPAQLQARGLRATRMEEAAEIAKLAVAFGLLAAISYLLFEMRWPDLAQFMFAGLGLLSAIVLSIGAAILRPQAGWAGVPEIIALNLVWGAGFGLLLPFVIRQFPAPGLW